MAKIAITLIEAVVSPAPLCVAQKPIAACDGKQLKLNDQGRAVFSAHKQMFSERPQLGEKYPVQMLTAQPIPLLTLDFGDKRAVLRFRHEDVHIPERRLTN